MSAYVLFFRDESANSEYPRHKVGIWSVVADVASYTESEQQDMIHYLEGADPSIINEETGQEIPQTELLISVYARPNNDEVKNTDNLRYSILPRCLMPSPPVVLERTVLHLFHNCLNHINLPDPRIK